ncbi:hypothetical protein GCM10027093_30530 [Paraburkholderia jirisanensis]
MARLIIYVPFPRGAAPIGDLRENAAELVNAPRTGFTIHGASISGVIDVYEGEEGDPQRQVAVGDVLCVHAHGGPGSYTDVTDNRGADTTLNDLLNGLHTLNAGNASASYFFVCYSAENAHIAQVWRAQNQNQRVYGCHSEGQGAIISTTRRSIKSSIFDATSRQITQLQ